MRVIIAGSPSIWDYKVLIDTVGMSEFVITEVLCATGDGVNRLAKLYALEHDINCTVFYNPKWDDVIAKADALITIVTSFDILGIEEVIAKAEQAGLKVFVNRVLN